MSAEIRPHFSKGLILNIQNRLKHVSCYPDLLGPETKIKLLLERN